MVLYERHIQVSVLNLINAASLRIEYQWRKHLFLSGCPNESHIVLRCTYNESQVRGPGQKKRWPRGGKEQKVGEKAKEEQQQRVAHFNVFLRQAMKLCLVIFKML